MATILEGVDYFIRVVPFPVPVGEMVTLNEDGTYNMYLNADYMGEDMRRHFLHGLNHIICDDLHGDKKIIDLEEDLRRNA